MKDGIDPPDINALKKNNIDCYLLDFPPNSNSSVALGSNNAIKIQPPQPPQPQSPQQQKQEDDTQAPCFYSPSISQYIPQGAIIPAGYMWGMQGLPMVPNNPQAIWQPVMFISPNQRNSQFTPPSSPINHQPSNFSPLIESHSSLFSKINTIQGMDILPLTLSFNSSTWQNRPARIYLNGEGLGSVAEFPNLTNIPRAIILSTPRTVYRTVVYRNRGVHVFSFDGFSEHPFFELQVWRRVDYSTSERELLLDHTDGSNRNPPISLERLGSSKSTIYCTINCEKGLKVQDLFIIGILRLENKLYISTDTAFPMSTNKRKIAEEKAKLPALYGPPPPFRQGKSTCSDVSEITSSWKDFETILLKLFVNGAVISEQIDSWLVRQAVIGQIVLERCRREFLSWFKSSCTLSGDVMIEKVILPILPESWFVLACTAKMLPKIIRERNINKEDYFMIHPTQNRQHYFLLDACYFDKDGEMKTYTAHILYEIDSKTKNLVFWVDTKHDARMSRSPSLSELVRYISQKTSWLPLPPFF